jgi:hypothetical protein
VAPADGPIGERVEREREEAADHHDERDGDEIGQMEPAHQRHAGERAHHHHLALREVEQVHRPDQHVVPEGDEAIDAAHGDAADERIEEHGRATAWRR